MRYKFGRRKKRMAFLFAAIILMSVFLIKGTTQTVCAMTTESAGQDYDDGGRVKLFVDNENRYTYMPRSYDEGYVPHVEGGVAHLVLPVIADGKLKDNRIEASLVLGDIQTMPFVCKNYKKNVFLKPQTVNDSENKLECYLVYFPLELKSDRKNGSYPVVINISGVSENGMEITKEFTVYVNISDGVNETLDVPVTEPPVVTAEEPPVFTPRVLVEDYEFSKDEICAGDTVSVDITLRNTNSGKRLRNMLVTAAAPKEYISLTAKNDSIYVDSVDAGGTAVMTYEFKVSDVIPQGNYSLELAIEYADSDGNSYNANETVDFYVRQPVCLETDSVSMPPEVVVSDVVTGGLQAINTGKSKVYNVRAVITADGLRADNTVFIGDIEPGQSALGETSIYVSSMSEGDEMYGVTKGTVTWYYEDEAGVEYTDTHEFYTRIQSPFSENTHDKVEDNPGQWWIIMLVIAAFIGVFALYMLAVNMRRRKQYRDNNTSEGV